VDKRITNGAHLPIEYSNQLTTVVLVEHDVVELVITVEQCWSNRVRRQTIEQPLRQRVHFRLFTRLRTMPTFGPSLNLSLNKALRLPEGTQTVSIDVYQMQIGKRVDNGDTNRLPLPR